MFKRIGFASCLMAFNALAFCWADAPIQPVPPQGPPRSPLSVDSPVNTPPDYMKYQPYNDGYIELDLWRLEATKFLRSTPVVSPDKSVMAYTEVTFMPESRQTFSKLYRVTIDPVDPSGPRENKVEASQARFDPNQTLKQRQLLLAVGSDKTLPFDFKTLTIIDWSASGQRLLFKQKTGLLHVGLRTSDLLIYDKAQGTVALYDEIQRAISHYWNQQGTLPPLDKIAWDLFPLGWEPRSDSAILLKAWAFDKKERKFLGLWKYDIDAERAELIGLQDETVPVAANGLSAEAVK